MNEFMGMEETEKYIRCALPDEGGLPHEYSIGNVYGLCASAWNTRVKKMSIPKNLAMAG